MGHENIVSSYSRLSCYQRCPRKFRYEYLDQQPEERTNAAMVLGVAFHAAAESYFREMMGNPNAGMSIEELTGEFDRSWSEQVQLCREFGVDLDCGKESEDALIQDGHALLGLLPGCIPAGHHIVAVEDSFSLDLAPGYSVQGVIDLILEGPDGEILVVDLKTSAATMAADRIQYDAQPTLYLYAANQRYSGTSASTRPVNFEFWIFKRTRIPKLERIPVPRNSRDFRELSANLMDVEYAVGQGVFPRIRSFMCTSCGYRDACSRDALDNVRAPVLSGPTREGVRLLVRRGGNHAPAA